MTAPKGNQFWKARSKHGRNKIFDSGEDLMKACLEYFEWVEDNPLMECRLISFQGEGTLKEVPKMRAMTISGLSIFLGINHDTWKAWRKDKDFSAVTQEVDAIILTQKFEGAAADLLNANIISRDLGLSDKSDVTQRAVQITSEMTPEDAAKAYREIMEGGN